MFERKVFHLPRCKEFYQIIRIGPHNHEVAPILKFFAPCIRAIFRPNTGFFIQALLYHQHKNKGDTILAFRCQENSLQNTACFNRIYVLYAGLY
jgi:hypothetical protein